MNVAMMPMDPQHPCDQPKQRPPLIGREFSTGSCLSSRSIISNASASSTRTHRRSRLEIGSMFFAHTPENRCPTVAIASYSGGTRVQSFDTLETRSYDGRSTRLLSPSPDSIEREHACDGSSTLRQSVRAVELIRELSFDSSSCEPERRPCLPSFDKHHVASNEESSCPPAHVDVGREERGSDETDEPPLPPKIKRLSTPPPVSVRHRSRSTSISEMSQSFFEDYDLAISDADSVFSSGSSPSATRDAVLRMPLPVETIESVSMIETMPTSRTSLNRGRTSTMTSCASTHSYVSSTSSDSSCCTSEGRTSEQDELILTLADFAPDGAGRSSVHDYYHGEYEETVHPRLTTEVLKRWNELQDRQKGEECFISRALSCASRLDGSSHTCSQSSIEYSESGPHLIASPNRALSHQSFELSYTNTGRSSGPPSTITSTESHRAASDLDFDVTFIYSYSQDKTHDDVDLDYSGHALRPKGHRRIRSTGSGVGFKTPTQPKNCPWDRPCKRRHRRFKSEGNIHKSRTLALPHDLSYVGNSAGVNDSPSSNVSRHRGKLSHEGTVENAASLASRKSHPTVTIRPVHDGSHRADFSNGTFSLHSLLVGFLMGLAVGMSLSA